MSFPTLPQSDYNTSNSLFQQATSTLQFTQQQQQHHQLQQRQEQERASSAAAAPPTQLSTKALAITSCATGGAHPPPLMGSAIVLANDSALHCFGGRLENRELTNCHYVLDVETCIWEVIYEASAPSERTHSFTSSVTGTE
ncbi:hypothetical protein BGZ65_012044, partial [Modicella reniformis]